MQMAALAQPQAAGKVPAGQNTATGAAEGEAPGLSFPSLLIQKQLAPAGCATGPQAPEAAETAANGEEAIAAQLAALMAIATAKIETPAVAEAKAALTQQGGPLSGEGTDASGETSAKTSGKSTTVQLTTAGAISKTVALPTAAAVVPEPTPANPAGGDDATGETPLPLQAGRATGFRIEAPAVAAAVAETKIPVTETPTPAQGATSGKAVDAQPLTWQAVAADTQSAASGTAEADAAAQKLPSKPAGHESTTPAPVPEAADAVSDEAPSAKAADSAPAPQPVAAAAGPVSPAPETAPVTPQAETGKEHALHARSAEPAPAHAAHAFESAVSRATGTLARPHGATSANPNPVHAASVRSQVIQQVAAQARPAGGVETVTLQLNPEHLGQVEIRFSGRDDQLQVVITASGTDAERALREGVRELADGIVERSGRWQQVDVKVELKDSNERRQERGTSDGDARQQNEGGRGGFQEHDGHPSRDGDGHAARDWAETGTGE